MLALDKSQPHQNTQIKRCLPNCNIKRGWSLGSALKIYIVSESHQVKNCTFFFFILSIEIILGKESVDRISYHWFIAGFSAKVGSIVMAVVQVLDLQITI